MSERKRFNTPTQNLNSTMYVRKTSASKGYSTNSASKTHLNETVCSTSGVSGEIPGIKASVTSGVLKFQVIQTECDLAYNDYLQSLLKYEIIENQIKEQEKVIKGQILFQEEVANEKRCALRQIHSDAGLLPLKEEILKMIINLEENINNLQRIYGNHQTQTHLETLHAALERRSNKLVMKNIHPIDTQDQYNTLINSLKKLVGACETVISSGRDFDGAHTLAEECRNFNKTSNKLTESHILMSTIEVNTINTILQKLSDYFAKQYENIED